LLVWQADAEEHGASFAFNTSVIGGAISNRNIEIYAGSTADLTAGLLPLSINANLKDQIQEAVLHAI
jgi:hypothetical protein